MMNLKDNGIILKRIAYNDSDWILTVLTSEGQKKSFIAKSARSSSKRFGPKLDLFNLVELVSTNANKNLNTLQSADLIQGMLLIRDDLKKFATACYFSEIILEFLPENEKSKIIFDITLELFSHLNTNQDFKPEIIPLMEQKFLDSFGYKPTLNNCLSCSENIIEEKNYFFDGAKGGVYCSDCHPNNSLTAHSAYPLTYNAITNILNHSILNSESIKNSNWQSSEVNQARKAFEYFIQITAGKPFKSLKFLSQILS